jgi:hypothetical protein
MNFTGFSDSTAKLHFAHNWWIFLAAAIPLTVATLGLLWTAWLLEEKKKRKQLARSSV